MLSPACACSAFLPLGLHLLCISAQLKLITDLHPHCSAWLSSSHSFVCLLRLLDPILSQQTHICPLSLCSRQGDLQPQLDYNYILNYSEFSEACMQICTMTQAPIERNELGISPVCIFIV